MKVNICVSGHRPNKLGYGYDIYNKKYDKLRDKLLEVYSYVKNKYEVDKFYNGLALGFDNITFEEWYFSNDNPNIVGCIPFEKQYIRWRKEDIEVYNIMKEKSNELVYVDTLDKYKVKNTKEGEFSNTKLFRRNEFMINNSDVLISCWDGNKNGGTWYAIRYALQSDNIIEIININPNTLEIEILKGE